MSEWQPIETAPKNADYLLLYRTGWQNCMAVGYWDRDLEMWIAQGNMFVGGTHWMPLPKEPDLESNS